MIFSIICPTLNEEKYIENILSVFIQFCPKPSELFVVDAGSTDQTRAIVNGWSKRHEGIYLIENPDKYVSHAFNKCYPLARGKYLALLGAHTNYSEVFFSTALTELEANQGDVVGGPLHQIGVGEWGNAIAYCMSTPFGVGGTEFRVSKKRSFVDSVAFAFYKREIFEKVGLFDTRLKRNQDDEMHYRMKAAGYRILMVPEMECDYYVRNSVYSLAKQYYQYGFYKPLVLRKVTEGLRPRHLIPSFFILYLFSLPFAFWLGFNFWFIPLGLYGLLNIKFSFINKLPLSEKFRSILIYPLLHCSYGLGFIFGFFSKRA
ncbi:MAG: glycosyltransferase family 2 protein [Cyclobacteriaceae bacterium]|nr:glycosyltransferase family 2 protein [Cyclobacteriaceae bacterium]